MSETFEGKPPDDFGSPPGQEATSSAEASEPQFGLIDVIEAFTAMRHECRGQIKEGRAAADAVRSAVAAIESLQSGMLKRLEPQPGDDPRAFAQTLVEIDLQLSRAVAALAASDVKRRQQERAEAAAVREYFDNMGGLAKWFARPLLERIMRAADRDGREGEPNAELEGLNVVLSRIRAALREHEIERSDVVGRPFDGSVMNAIDSVVSHEHPPGHVAEQLAACYRWRGKLLRFAEVRVAS